MAWPPKLLSRSEASPRASKRQKPPGLRQEPRPSSPSRQITTAGTPYRSASREATMPLTP